MKRSECYMTFSQALEQYLQARKNASSVGVGRNRTWYENEMQVAAEHMDALTGDGDKEDE